MNSGSPGSTTSTNGGSSSTGSANNIPVTSSSSSSSSTSTTSTPGVVERASKEISRRITSLGFKRSKPATQPPPSKPNSRPSPESAAAAAAEADKLNGNEATAAAAAAAASPPALPNAHGGATPNAAPPSAHSAAASAASSSLSAASKMGIIIKGSVMDKVTHVFNSSSSSGNSSNSSMGNGNGKESSNGSGGKSTSPPPNVSNGDGSTAADISAGGSASNGINIPKGAVANGRAKFEANAAICPGSPTPEKPLRFMQPRSRQGSPMLPVKSPKVPSTTAPPPPAAAAPAEGAALFATGSSSTAPTRDSSKRASGGDATDNIFVGEAEATAKTAVISKLLPKMKRFVMFDELWSDPAFLSRFFEYFTHHERFMLAQVCTRWRDTLYKPVFWKGIRPVLRCRTLRTWTDNESQGLGKEMKRYYFHSLQDRGFESLVLLNANDADVYDFIQNYPHGAKHASSLVLRCCNLSDRGLEALMEFLQGLFQLEVAGCNEITEQGLWSSLHPRLVSVTINDCINVADECICAVTQLLPSLYEFNLQAYHVTDSALSYFSPKQTATLNILRLQSCWEITNHGIVNIVHTLPNLTVLSLSGCSKITDDGIELIAENLRKLRSLDVSWCPRVTDAALEYIACDLNNLEQLTLDRCVHITDIGIGYISTMVNLHTLYLRWCGQIRDFGLSHLCGMRGLQVLSLAGCPQCSSSAMSNLIQLRNLAELELTNCPGATSELIEYLRQNLPNTLVLD